VSHKSPRIAALLAELQADPQSGSSIADGTNGLPLHYVGFFHCFNRGLYFEAHDVLEELWLSEGKSGSNYAFYKGLIQWAGAFVHLQKGRLRPAVALFDLAAANLRRYPIVHQRLDLQEALADIQSWRSAIESADFLTNPLPLRPSPRIRLNPA